MTKQISYNQLMDNFCINCGKLIPKLDNLNRKLSDKVYKKKKYCCRNCADEYRKANRVGWYGVDWITPDS